MRGLKERLSVEVRADQKRFIDGLPHGWTSQLIRAYIDKLMLAYKLDGTRALSAIASKSVTIDHLFPEEGPDGHNDS